jgi:hypothetical protein
MSWQARSSTASSLLQARSCGRTDWLRVLSHVLSRFATAVWHGRQYDAKHLRSLQMPE